MSQSGRKPERRDRIHVEFVALPQEISVAQTECSSGDCEREISALQKTLFRL